MHDGLKIEMAAAFTLRDLIRQHMQSFALTIRTDRVAGQNVVAAYVDGLAGAVALTIVSGHGSKDDVINATVTKLREAVDRDLRHLGREHAQH
jgi:hypothetical protein